LEELKGAIARKQVLIIAFLGLMRYIIPAYQRV